MTLSNKASLGLALMAVTIILIAAVGYYGINRLSNTLEYVVGPAWNSADGAMETTIEIQKQVLQIEKMLAGKPLDNASHQESKKAAADAVGRLEKSGLVPSDIVAKLTEARRDWHTHENRLITQYQQFASSRNEFRNVTASLVTLLEEIEAQGDAAVETLEKNPDTMISWNSGLSAKWQAADGGMEATIGLLQQLYLLERLLRVEDPSTAEAELSQAATFMDEAIDGMLQTNSFAIPSTTIPGKSQAEALNQQVSHFKQLLAQVVAEFKTYMQSNIEYQASTNALLTLMEHVEGTADSKVDEQVKLSEGTINSVYSLMTAVFIAGLIMAGFLALMTRKMIMSPLIAITERIHNIAMGDGDLTKRTGLNREDEIGDLSRYVDQFIERLQSMISKIKHNGLTIRELVSRTGSSADVINGSSEKTAHQADEVAVASEQMSQVSSEIASSCVRAADSAEQASQLANIGQQRVEDTVSSMRAITERVTASSESIGSLKSQAGKIGEIVSVIAGISEQTNLLALNAAIEAARAGDQGRGFAVVADEVRTLAQRTAESTKEITDVIRAIQEQTNQCFTLMESCVGEVQDGMTKSADAGKSLAEIRHQMAELSMMITQISTATEQQTVTIAEISSKVQTIATLAQQSNIDARQSRDFVHKLNDSSDELDGELAQFTV
ncbi:methyl-accepting chemotaxis protein [Shewanella avicenniae]|uniref:Methyl-accepting chemotaxis protein n=1 Tax=Shewanella avicenniae TaxID=2814294 RepID=A0ABX7QMT9_9GAMM|nr:methyl-accepting chemotaxis protein [Shewanella avicenniae]QSX32205.1 methyl-accepting chemotaxis protein [Shewanella avicenniae]